MKTRSEMTQREILQEALDGLDSFFNAETTTIANRNALGDVRNGIEYALACCPLPELTPEEQATIDANYLLPGTFHVINSPGYIHNRAKCEILSKDSECGKYRVKVGGQVVYLAPSELTYTDK